MPLTLLLWPLNTASTAAQELSAGSEPGPAELETADLSDARRLLAERKFTEAAAILEQLAEQQPASVAVQRALGQAYFGAEQWAKAATAQLRAAADDGIRDAAWWDAARALGKDGRGEEAIVLLEQLARRGRVDLTAVRLLPEFDAVENNPRVRSLLPDAAAIADPFAEHARILHEWRGEASGDSFGWIARRLGDVDGDGFFDVVTSAIQHATGGNNAGRVYAFSGKTGKRLWTRDGEEGWLLGRGVESAGDVDGDGREDVVASAPGGDRVFVFSGPTGETLLELKAAQERESFGQHVDGAGDLDDDGHADLIVGAPQHHGNGQAAGRVAVYSGKTGAMLFEVLGSKAGARLGETVAAGKVGPRNALMAGAPGAGKTYVWHGLEQTPKHVFEAEISGAAFGGMFMSVVGDIDADGTEDYYVADWADAVRGAQTGRIYLFSGQDGRRLFTLAGEAAGDGFGIGVADAGDINRDGHADLAVGAWRHGSAAPSGGRVYIISGKDGTIRRTLTSKVMGETFGFDSTHLGDIDGDGTFDLLLTSAWSPLENGVRTGRVFVIAGESFE